MPRKRQADEQLELIYSLRGEIRSVDVFALAPALFSLGELIQSAHRELGADHQVGVNVKPFGRGSFVVGIVLYVQSHPLPILTISTAAGAALTRTKEILEAVGFVRSKAVSAIEAIRRLRGKPKSIEPVAPGTFRYTNGDNSVEVNGTVHTLLQNTTIQNATFQLVSGPASQPGVKEIQTVLRNHPETAVTIKVDEVPAFAEFVAGEMPTTGTPHELENPPITYFLKPKRISVEGEPNNWSFRVGGWESDILTVDSVKDQTFLQKVKRGEYRLTKDDLLVAEVVHRQRLQGTEIVSETTELLKVKAYTPSPVQQNLQLELPPSTTERR
jgi:hypothetical protein